jgi:hypothetical protein
VGGGTEASNTYNQNIVYRIMVIGEQRELAFIGSWLNGRSFIGSGSSPFSMETSISTERIMWKGVTRGSEPQ